MELPHKPELAITAGIFVLGCMAVHQALKPYQQLKESSPQ